MCAKTRHHSWMEIEGGTLLQRVKRIIKMTPVNTLFDTASRILINVLLATRKELYRQHADERFVEYENNWKGEITNIHETAYFMH